MTIKTRYISTDGWRGYYEPVAPEGYELLADSQIVNESGEQARDIIAKWLRSQKIRYRSGYLPTSNVFSANMYIIAQAEKISEDLRQRIDNWFVDTVTSTFSIFSGESWALDVDEAQRKFDVIVAQRNSQ